MHIMELSLLIWLLLMALMIKKKNPSSLIIIIIDNNRSFWKLTPTQTEITNFIFWILNNFHLQIYRTNVLTLKQQQQQQNLYESGIFCAYIFCFEHTFVYPYVYSYLMFFFLFSVFVLFLATALFMEQKTWLAWLCFLYMNLWQRIFFFTFTHHSLLDACMNVPKSIWESKKKKKWPRICEIKWKKKIKYKIVNEKKSVSQVSSL